ncbi:radical SAM family heme chaperone HemW [Thermosynechococcus sp. JY1334]|uniref:radical SAM family heme chaperone HemW n=1 Tax=unclassified Thermosynechococcus TaxID=2622553 RepID=UPI0026716120|nr:MULTISPECIES: radical SAM family heme chaperone HemW [unclassified Thermosynechococcus]MDR7899092.1 radical SAM family heme chaperone HemW [Thermosynechococcus sp. JY1332]MDR7906499.1 radical SAM family heme chaperone HemW [Thermosynechococcus sp. JY1334]WKT86215.1 radical SAM family heme chaperone HemW [Thermosynechococcus sp. JY1339]WNC55160.1 radical SAM family heme chaperone HemW [Thermosynechococcus sp. JY1331]
MTRAAYIHLPFCRRRCFYCDFPITVVGDSPTLAESLIQEYVAALCQEIAHTPAEPPSLQTIFFGGGTPSLVPPQYIGQLLEALDRQIGIAQGAEISMEMDPGTFDLKQLQAYLKVGVNRVSLGVQAFDNELLQVCGRSHDVTDVERAVALIHEVGVENWSMDLILGLPNQSLQRWQRSLEQAIALNPTHLSIYDLIIEPKTVFSKRYQPEAAPLPTQEQAAAAYRLGHEILTAAGYDHYEISNYARPGFACRHNQVYWRNQPYYGFGMGATSYLGHCRLSRPRTRREYYQWLQSLPESLNQVSPDARWDRWLETLMLGLRLRDGLSLTALADEFPMSWVEALQAAAANMSPEMLSLTGDRLHLTQPEGFLMANTVIVTLWEAMERSVFHQQQGQPLPIH